MARNSNDLKTFIEQGNAYIELLKKANPQKNNKKIKAIENKLKKALKQKSII